MENDKIQCPKCGTNIPITDVLKQRMIEQINDQVESRLQKEKEALLENTKKELEAKKESELSIIKKQLEIEAKKREESEKKELEMLKVQSELEDKMKKQELIIARKVADEKKMLEEKIRKEEGEKNQFVIMEMRKQLEDTKKSLAEAQRKAQQGSMQTQGEVMELSLEDTLRSKFPHDNIEPVAKGIKGADIVQKVCTPNGNECGIIVWESKQTKNWTEDWVQKLKDDGRNIKANALVLVSEVLPKDITNFGIYKGIWVANFNSVLGLTMALRNQLLSINTALQSQVDKGDKKEVLYDYLCGPAFASKIESIVETFVTMKSTLDKEKVAMEKIWSMRETQINRLTENTAKIYGEIQGIAGNQLLDVGILELESLSLPESKEKPMKAAPPAGKKEKDDSPQANLF